MIAPGKILIHTQIRYHFIIIVGLDTPHLCIISNLDDVNVNHQTTTVPPAILEIARHLDTGLSSLRIKQNAVKTEVNWFKSARKRAQQK